MVTIREVKSDEKKIIDEIVTIHLNTFTGFFLTFMGRGFLRQMYQSYCDHEESGLLVAEGDGKTVGFLAYEIDEALRMKKPIIGIKPWGNQRIPEKIQQNATVLVGWNSSSLVSAVRNYAL